MNHIRFSDLAQWLGHSAPISDCEVKNISSDTRTMKVGEIFIALRGENFDGNNFISQAITAGAAGVIVEKPGSYSVPAIVVKDATRAFAQIGSKLRERFAGPVMAVTGSAGKSSTKEMLATLLGNNVLSSPASFNNLIGLSKTLCLVSDSTREMVLEMGMNASGEIAELCRFFNPQYGIITNIGDAHLGKLGNQEGIRKAKKELFEHLSGRSDAGVALNSDDPLVEKSYGEVFSKVPRTIRYSCRDSSAEVCVFNIKINPTDAHLNFQLRAGGESCNVRLPIFGLHHAQNFAAAIAGTQLFGRSLTQVSQNFSAVKPAKHRGEIVVLKEGSVLIDESYNSNPSALKSSLNSLLSLDPKLSHLLILGEMRELEDHSDELHQSVGKFLIENYKAHPRQWRFLGVGEKMKPVAEQLRTQGVPVHFFATQQEAQKAIPAFLCARQAVLVKGSRGIGLDLTLNTIIGVPAK